MTITIEPVNDKQHYLLLDGDNSSSAITVTFIEEGDPVLLSRNLRIDDEDVGEKFLYGAIVYIIDCELCISKLCNQHLVLHSSNNIGGSESWDYFMSITVRRQNLPRQS